jgi:PAS domain-containing protein
MLGYGAPENLAGQRTEALWGMPGEAARIWQTLIDTGRWIGVTNALRLDGSVRVVQVSASLVRAPDGTPIGAIASCVDITAQREAERALGESQRRLVTLMDNLPGGFASAAGTTRSGPWRSSPRAASRCWAIHPRR